MTDLSATPIKGRAMRLVQLDTCGNPVTGASGLVVVTRGFVQVQAEPQYEDGEQQRLRLADGSLCVNDDDPDDFTNVNLTIDFCGVCPSVAQITNGARLIGDAGPPVTGTGAAYGEGQLTARWSLEVWQNVTGRGACDANGLQRYVYWAWPNVGNGRVGSLTIANSALTMQIAAKTDAVGSLWSNFLGSDWLPAGEAFEEGEHYLWNITTEPPPDIPENCGAVPLE